MTRLLEAAAKDLVAELDACPEAAVHGILCARCDSGRAGRCLSDRADERVAIRTAHWSATTGGYVPMQIVAATALGKGERGTYGGQYKRRRQADVRPDVHGRASMPSSRASMRSMRARRSAFSRLSCSLLYSSLALSP